MKRITFKKDDRDRGLDIIVRSGTVVWTEESGVYLVDEECIEALERNQIPYLRIKSRKTFKDAPNKLRDKMSLVATSERNGEN